MAKKLLTFRQIIRKAMNLFVFSLFFNILTSIVISFVLLGSFSLTCVLDNFGNLTLLEIMIFFFAGGAIDISHSAKWSAAMKLLRLSSKNWNVNESRMAERRASIYILTGISLLAELLLLTLFGSSL